MVCTLETLATSHPRRHLRTLQRASLVYNRSHGSQAKWVEPVIDESIRSPACAPVDTTMLQLVPRNACGRSLAAATTATVPVTTTVTIRPCRQTLPFHLRFERTRSVMSAECLQASSRLYQSSLGARQRGFQREAVPTDLNLLGSREGVLRAAFHHHLARPDMWMQNMRRHESLSLRWCCLGALGRKYGLSPWRVAR